MLRRISEVVAAVVLGALLVVALGLLFGQDSDTTADEVPSSSQTQVANKPVDPELFLAAYERSLTGTYIVSGTQTVSLDGVQIGVSTFKHVRRGDQSLEQEGAAVLMVDGAVQRVCDQPILATETTCQADQPAPTTAQRVDLFRRNLEPQGAQARADYEVYAGKPGCWQTIGTRPMPNSPWGQTTLWCFDQATGALVLRETTTGTEQIRLEATTIVAAVRDGDFVIDE